MSKPLLAAEATQLEPIAFVDLKAQRLRIAAEIAAAIDRVFAHGIYIMGPEVRALEERLAAYSGVRHAITCASGTDALLLPLMARGFGVGDAVFCPSFTFAATAEVVAFLGAVPVFVDVNPDSFNIDPASLERAVLTARKLGLRPAAVIPVDLFGLPAEYDQITDIAKQNGLFVLEDAAQGFGATYRGQRLCSFGDAAGTSFFPAKPLGCYGDGGAVLTNDDALAATMRSLRVHGQGTDKYDNVRIGINGRIDTLQAAILLEKLAIFDDEIVRRERVAERYRTALSNLVTVPVVPPHMRSVWAQYTIKLENRDGVAAALKSRGIPTAVYYPLPLHLQTAYKNFPRADERLEVSERLSQSVLSLPMHPYLDEHTQDRIVDTLRDVLDSGLRNLP